MTCKQLKFFWYSVFPEQELWSIENVSVVRICQNGERTVQILRGYQESVSLPIFMLMLSIHFYTFTSMLQFLTKLYRSRIKFCVNSHHDIERQSVMKVISRELYSQDPVRTPIQNGVLDRRMVI